MILMLGAFYALLVRPQRRKWPLTALMPISTGRRGDDDGRHLRRIQTLDDQVIQLEVLPGTSVRWPVHSHGRSRNDVRVMSALTMAMRIVHRVAVFSTNTTRSSADSRRISVVLAQAGVKVKSDAGPGGEYHPEPGRLPRSRRAGISGRQQHHH